MSSTCDTGQAILLPDEFRINADEVVITRTADGLGIVPRDLWDLFYQGVEELSDEFFSEGRQQPPVENRECACSDPSHRVPTVGSTP